MWICERTGQDQDPIVHDDVTPFFGEVQAIGRTGFEPRQLLGLRDSSGESIASLCVQNYKPREIEFTSNGIRTDGQIVQIDEDSNSVAHWGDTETWNLSAVPGRGELELVNLGVLEKFLV